MKKLFIPIAMLCLIIFYGVYGNATTPKTSKVPVQSDQNTVLLQSNSANAEYSDYFSDVLIDDSIVGAATAIVTGSEILFMDGFGFRDIDANLQVTNETLFHIGSVTKSFTALLIAALVDDGILEWDSLASTLYPKFKLSEEASTNTVSIRHLLSMQSGIPDWAEDDFDVDNASADDVIPFVSSIELLDKPGKEFSYSNISSSIAGYLGVIAATGSATDVYNGYAALLTERVLRPIGMQSAEIKVSNLLNNPNYGKSYILHRNKAEEAEREDYDGDALAPSGVIKANIHEMASYIQLQLNKGISANGQRVVSEKNITETWQANLEDYGMGWEIRTINGVKVIMHEGEFDSYLSVVGFAPEHDLGFVILTNTADAAEGLIEEAPEVIFEIFAK